MRRGFKCKKEVFEILSGIYIDITKKEFSGNFLEALEQFEVISEKVLRKRLAEYYSNHRSTDQAWRSCKGSIYEFAVYQAIKFMLRRNGLDKIFSVEFGDDVLKKYKESYVIKNWSEIYPDADILLLKKDRREEAEVVAIISCKTSLRERLTETAFWRRELERDDRTKNVKVFFVTTDKDDELKGESNRYILLHVIDATFITNHKNYERLMNTYKEKYGKRKDFYLLKDKVLHIKEFPQLIGRLLK